MTHPTPTTAKSASPPPRGEGLGVGGLSLILAALFLTTPATAQIIPTGTPAADILLSQAITEQRFFLTCTILDTQTHGFLSDLWQAEVIAVTDLLTENNVRPEAIAAFITAAQPDSLLPAPDTPLKDVRQFCAADADWIRKVNRMEMINLSRQLPQAFE
jgi:hypothetical protein